MLLVPCSRQQSPVGPADYRSCRQALSSPPNSHLYVNITHLSHGGTSIPRYYQARIRAGRRKSRRVRIATARARSYSPRLVRPMRAQHPPASRSVRRLLGAARAHLVVAPLAPRCVAAHYSDHDNTMFMPVPPRCIRHVVRAVSKSSRASRRSVVHGAVVTTSGYGSSTPNCSQCTQPDRTRRRRPGACGDCHPSTTLRTCLCRASRGCL